MMGDIFFRYGQIFLLLCARAGYNGREEKGGGKMEEKQELQELLERLDKSNRQQARYARWQCVFSVAAALCCVGLFLAVYALMPQVQALSAQTESVLANLETVTAQLAGMDLGAMGRDLGEVTGKLNAIDFAALNQAIRDLGEVVEPMARFFGMFN